MQGTKAEKVTFDEFIKEANNTQGYIIAALTDEYIVDIWPVMQEGTLEDKEEKILEIRIFNKDEEFKLVRTDISKDFVMRHRKDENLEERDYMDESQYLDIDTKKTGEMAEKGGYVYATGGGRYYLPENKVENLKIKIRYYFDRYKNSGQARICDWRVVGFEKTREGEC